MEIKVILSHLSVKASFWRRNNYMNVLESRSRFKDALNAPAVSIRPSVSSA